MAASGMGVFLQHRLVVAIVGVALVATAGVFLFARPQYRQPGATKSIPIPSYVGGPVHGWTWKHGLPGYRFGRDEEFWNAARLLWADLAPARYGARAAGVDPQSLRMLTFPARTRPRTRPYLLVAGRDAHGRTCVGAQLSRGPVEFYCPRRLAGSLAVLLVAPQPQWQDGLWSTYVMGVVQSRVTRVTVSAAADTYTDMRSGKAVVRPADPQLVWQQGWKSWGSFDTYPGQPVPWKLRIDFYGAHGLLESLPLKFAAPVERVVVVH